MATDLKAVLAAKLAKSKAAAAAPVTENQSNAPQIVNLQISETPAKPVIAEEKVTPSESQKLAAPRIPNLSRPALQIPVSKQSLAMGRPAAQLSSQSLVNKTEVKNASQSLGNSNASAAPNSLQRVPTLHTNSLQSPIQKSQSLGGNKQVLQSAPAKSTSFDKAALLAKLARAKEIDVAEEEQLALAPRDLTQETQLERTLARIDPGVTGTIAKTEQKLSASLDSLKQTLTKPVAEQAKIVAVKAADIVLNKEQLFAVETALSDASEQCLIGAAGTGKTTVVKTIAARLLESKLKGIKMQMDHKHLPTGIPPIVFTSFTNRAVRNLRRVLPPELSKNCVTIHALLEYYFEYEQVEQADGSFKNSRRAVPKRGHGYPLDDIRYLVLEESSMCSVGLFDELHAALPADCQIIFLGDLNQLPPIYDSAILGFKLTENIPITELTQVYRQALDNPILFDAHKILAGDNKYFSEERIKAGKLNRLPYIQYKPFKKRVEPDIACHIIGGMFQKLMDVGEYKPEEDCILIPYNKQFGTLELNKYIAQKRQEQSGVPVYEVISLYVRHYFAVGDRILIGKYEGTITNIYTNSKYTGKKPRPSNILMNRWGNLRSPNGDEGSHDKSFDADEGEFRNMSTEDIDAMLAKMSADDDAKRQASHIIEVRLPETGDVITLSEAGEINAILFAYALTVHKAQGAEWRRVFFILHNSHGTMAARELVYTAFTRAREELIILCDPALMEDSVLRQRIKGNSLKEKAEFFKGKKMEKQAKQTAFGFANETGDK